MNVHTIQIKPLSVNDCWQGRRFKTDKYKDYEKLVLLMLPKQIDVSGPFRIKIEFGFSNVQSDIDNPLKPFLDILQKKYSINDKEVYELIVKKTVVKKGNEFIRYSISQIKEL